jgi:hypothetical protein
VAIADGWTTKCGGIAFDDAVIVVEKQLQASMLLVLDDEAFGMQA